MRRSGFRPLPARRLLRFQRAGDLLVKLKQERDAVAVPGKFPLGIGEASQTGASTETA